MTHPLSAELRREANERRLDIFRRAADALDEVETERDSLKAQLEHVELQRGEYRNLAHDKIVQTAQLLEQLGEVTAERDKWASDAQRMIHERDLSEAREAGLREALRLIADAHPGGGGSMAEETWVTPLADIAVQALREHETGKK